HDARTVSALEQGVQLRQSAFEFEEKSRRLRLQHELLRLKIRLDHTAGLQRGPVMNQKCRHFDTGKPQRALKNSRQGFRQCERLKATVLKQPCLFEQDGS